MATSDKNMHNNKPTQTQRMAKRLRGFGTSLRIAYVETEPQCCHIKSRSIRPNQTPTTWKQRRHWWSHQFRPLGAQISYAKEHQVEQALSQSCTPHGHDICNPLQKAHPSR